MCNWLSDWCIQWDTTSGQVAILQVLIRYPRIGQCTLAILRVVRRYPRVGSYTQSIQRILIRYPAQLLLGSNP
jgi:hypothetical protein